MLKIDEIRIYPVKGLRGVSVREADVEPWGLAGDRRWMVVDPQQNFISQRQFPRMALIDATLHHNGLRLSATGAEPIDVPVPQGGAGPVEVTLWKSRVAALPAEPGADAWLWRVLGAPCRLVYMADPANDRPADPDYASPADRVSFADGFPLLATNAASLVDLNARLARPVPMDRFRTSVLVSGAPAWAEDGWRRLRIGEAEFKVVKDCARCAVITVDQSTGQKAEDNEPLRTLGSFRRDVRGRTLFGQNLIPTRLGRIAVGDGVEVLG